MLKTRTHFEQIPLETVRKIIEAQLRRETIVEQAQETKQDSLSDLTDRAPKTIIRLQ